MSWSDLRPRRTLLALGAAVSAVGLAGCGFRLRQAPSLSFQSVALTGFGARSPLADELKRALAQRVQVLADANAADVVLQALADARERSVVAQTSAAQVRELSLRVRLQFRAHTPSGRELLPTSVLLLARDMSYSETSVLAKEQEEAELYREMQQDIVSQVMRRLATIKI